MAGPPPTPDPVAPTLLARKQRLARQRIVDAADELFAARGYAEVSVTDIAARAEVGRTTFFRYFGDKTEVVFAKEQAMLATVARAAGDRTEGAARTARDAVEQLRPVLLDLCEQATDDPEAYRRHAELVERHLELRAREALKTQEIAASLVAVLRSRGTDEAVAVLAAQVALACYQTARQRTRSAADVGLTRATQAAFDEVLALGGG